MPLEDELPAALRVLVADDHPLVREGVVLLIGTTPGWEVCGTAANGREVVEKAIELRPDIIVLDLHMPELDGLAVVRELKRRLPETEVVIFSGARVDAVAQELFSAGAKSFVGKTDGSDLLRAAIQSAAEHKPFFTPTVSELLYHRFVADPRAASSAGAELTEREREIIAQIAEGKSNKDMATALGISIRTAETHRASIQRKLGVSSTAEIVRYAIRMGIIEA
jgi:DNA-binding NarL/FixJ family response regulator